VQRLPGIAGSRLDRRVRLDVVADHLVVTGPRTELWSSLDSLELCCSSEAVARMETKNCGNSECRIAAMSTAKAEDRRYGPSAFRFASSGYLDGMHSGGAVDVGRRVFERLRSVLPLGGPDRPYLSVLSLLARRLCDDEVDLIVARLSDSSETVVDDATIGTLIMGITQELPLPDDVARVRARTAYHS
jgi:hypothetical protein